MGVQSRRLSRLGWKVRDRSIDDCLKLTLPDSSVRAWRGLRFNEKYAAKLAKKKSRQAQKVKPEVQESTPAIKSNPFSVCFVVSVSSCEISWVHSLALLLPPDLLD